MSKSKKKKSDDVLEKLAKRIRKSLSKEARIADAERTRRLRMAESREWSLRHGNGKIPTWTEINWSPARAPIMVHRAWWTAHNVPTRTRIKTLKSGKKRYYLDIYNHTARQLKGSKRKVKKVL